MSTLHNNFFGTNIESQEMSFSGSFLTSLEECLESAYSKDKIVQPVPAASPLMSSQMVHIQGDIYQTLEIGIPIPTLLSFGYVAHSLEPPFVDPP